MMTFLELNNRYELALTLHAEGGLHIGTGVAAENTDAPFIRSGGQAFIPGSSLRGAIRSHLERLVRTLRGPEGSHVLFETCAATICVAGASSDDLTRKRYERATGRQYDELALPVLCPICRLFGSTLMAARLKIGDSTLLPAFASQPLNRRDGVGIDRDTGTAKEHIKYDFEVLEGGADFQCTMEVENAEDSEFALLYMLIAELRRGLYVGGKACRGFGRVRLKEYTVSYFDPDWGYGLDEYLGAGLRDGRWDEFESRLSQSFKRWLKPAA